MMLRLNFWLENLAESDLTSRSSSSLTGIEFDDNMPWGATHQVWPLLEDARRYKAFAIQHQHCQRGCFISVWNVLEVMLDDDL